LECDRVVIYNANNLPYAGVLAESLKDQCISFVGQTIQDPFLKDDYLEMYCYGMSLTIDDIYTSEVSSCDLEYLAKLGIKSVAIAPIYVDGELSAFLVAHQCLNTKNWDLGVVNFLAEKAGALGLALSSITKDKITDSNLIDQQDPVNNNAVHLFPNESKVNDNSNKNPLQQGTLIQQTKNKLFANLQSHITNEKEQENILNITAEQTRQLLQCDRVVILSLYDSRAMVVAESVAEPWTKTAELIDGNADATYFLGKDPDDQIQVWNSIDDSNAPLPYQQYLSALEVQAGIIVPIVYQNTNFGLLIAHNCSCSRTWQEQEINWTTQIANQIGKIVKQIKNSNDTQQTENQRLNSFRKQLDRDQMWTQHFANAISKIRQSLNAKDILTNSVREVHRVLNCDRVLVYTLTHDSYGKITAESVSSGWTKALGKTIKDPCFEARYLAKYRDGRFRAWNNIYEAGMGTCYIEQLEKLEVKANLVVPIISEGKLFGLLVMQQCSGTRQWQQAEILWVIQIATQIGFALDNSQLITDAQKLRNQAEQEKIWTEYFTEAVQQIRQSLSEKDVLKASVREVRRVINCDRVLVYTLTEDSYGLIAAESVAHGWTRAEGRVIKDPCFEARYLDKYRDGRVRAWNNIYEAGMSKCYIEQLENIEVKANLVIPIIKGEKLFGLLVAQQCSDTRQWQQSEIDWLTQIAIQVGFALENANLLSRLNHCKEQTQTILNSTSNSGSNIRRIVTNFKVGLESIDSSCINFAKAIGDIKDLSKHLAHESMNMTRIINLNQTDKDPQSSVAESSEQIFSLIQELYETIGKIDPLFTNIKTEITGKFATLDTETEMLVDGLEDFQIASHNLEEIFMLTQEMVNLIDKTSEFLEAQIKNSTFTQDSVLDLTNITERISHQSIKMIEAFKQFLLLSKS